MENHRSELLYRISSIRHVTSYLVYELEGVFRLHDNLRDTFFADIDNIREMSRSEVNPEADIRKQLLETF